MSLTYGFYNSLNHDRRYSAIQMSSIFDGIINDGIFMSIGDRFNVTANGSDMVVTVGSGRAWFNHTWTLNDALLPIEIPQSELILNRYDAVVLEVNAEQSVRANSIKVVRGIASSNPAYPTLVNTDSVHQYPLAYIYVEKGATSIRQANVTNVVGKDPAPYVTGIIETINIENVVAQWEDQWEEWFSDKTSDGDGRLDTFIQWMDDKQVELEEWLESIKDTLASVENGELLERIQELLNDFYNMATDSDIDRIINGTYVEEDETSSWFQPATDQDIDNIIKGSYVEDEENEGNNGNQGGNISGASDEEIKNIVDGAFE